MAALTWIDITVILIVLGFTFFIFYRGPMRDAINAGFSYIGKGLSWLVDKASGAGDLTGAEVIKYE